MYYQGSFQKARIEMPVCKSFADWALISPFRKSSNIAYMSGVWGALADCSLLSLSPSGSWCPGLHGCGLNVYYGRQFPWWRRNELCRLGSNYGLPPPPPRQPAAGVGLPLGIHTQRSDGRWGALSLSSQLRWIRHFSDTISVLPLWQINVRSNALE